MSHLFVVKLGAAVKFTPEIDRVEKILKEYDRLFIGCESTNLVWKFRWVVEKFPEIDNEFKTFLKLQIGHDFEISDWHWIK